MAGLIDRRCGHLLKEVEGRLDLLDVQIARNNHDPAAMLLVRPVLQMPRGMNDMLNALKHEWTSSLSHVEEPLEPQDVLSVLVQQHGQPNPKHVPVQGAVHDDAA